MNDTASSPVFAFEDFKRTRKRLLAALRQEPSYILLTGESGTGKSTLLRDLRNQLDRSRYRILYLSHAQLTASGLTRVLAAHLHIQPSRSQGETNKAIVRAIRESAGRTLLWLDEAQQLTEETLSELRILAEAELLERPLFSTLLVGMPELRARLAAPRLFPLWRRIRLRLEITGLLREEVTDFLTTALDSKDIARFPEAAITALFERGRGNPGLILAFAQEALQRLPQGTIEPELLQDLLDAWDLP